MRTPRPTLYEQTDTPGGSIYWEPHVNGIPIPVEGNSYGSIDEAFHMYVKYAEMAGFEVKKGGQKKTKSGAVLNKYIYCNKEGVPKPININTLDPQYQKQKRNTTTHATGCKAHIRLVLNIVSGRYKLETFNPKHNHMLIPKEYRHFTKKQRKMNQSEKMFVVKAAANKIGATKAHHLYCNIKGGYEYVHGTTDDFKNHQRDVNHFIGESDAQMLINKMENRTMYVPNFTFQYMVDNDELVAMFWADEVAKCNYKEFGDIVSFDATFNSNKYNMKFVPFIGIDNHGKCVTLGSGMLLHEDTKSYTWLLTTFMSAFLKEPTMIVTDQDGAMKRAIEAVLRKPNTDFACAYFIDSSLFGLIRTTSRSQRENSFFKSFTSPGATLVSFMMSYESAMERQRYRQEKLDFNTIDAAPKFITQLDIESHASKVYTRTMFLIVQTEINEGCWNCTVQGLNRDEGCENFVIRDNKPNENKSLFHKKKQQKGKEKEKETQTVGQTARDYKVLLNIEDGSVNRDIKVIPKQYILRRWTRDIIPPDLRRKENRYGEKNVNIQRLTNEANFLVDDTLFLLSKDEEKMGTYVTNLKKLLDDVKTDMPNPPSRDTVIEDVFSVKQTNDVQVKNPTKAVNKGEHLKKGERLKSEREKAIKVAKKKARPCGFCKEVTNEHTKLTCPLNPNARKKRKATPVIDV
ncbi:regulation of nuclear pre-mRNA domain-containing protein 1B [Tanacetum coccineum]|uniref:Regulation of nuclear pre-mRNA domain-containing protein 1B n=1 Tax=Tanacetum coccineum TaxID=301880 RepID=A0ABQ5BY82_9ASTR